MTHCVTLSLLVAGVFLLRGHIYYLDDNEDPAFFFSLGFQKYATLAVKMKACVVDDKET